MPLHPQAQAFVDSIAEKNPPGWDELPLAEARETFASFGELFGDGPDVPFSDHAIDRGVGIRVYRPEADGLLPTLMYFHGGGWVLGDLETHRSLCSKLAVAANCVVVAVNYRKAPEHAFPAAFDDCYAATVFVAENGSQFGTDSSRLAVAGDSAGGNLAAAVALKARDVGGPNICHQSIIYGAMDPTYGSESYQAFATEHGLTRHVMRWFWEQYIEGDVHQDEPYAAPGRVTDLTGLPPAHVVTAEFDVLRDEGEAFAERLQAAGVPTVFKRYDGMLHGFMHFAGAFDDAEPAILDVANQLRFAFSGQ